MLGLGSYNGDLLGMRQRLRDDEHTSTSAPKNIFLPNTRSKAEDPEGTGGVKWHPFCSMYLLWAQNKWGDSIFFIYKEKF